MVRSQLSSAFKNKIGGAKVTHIGHSDFYKIMTLTKIFYLNLDNKLKYTIWVRAKHQSDRTNGN